ncbi:MAG TPA: ABC transporter substrate-binding protein [Burkholderiaceae bacterium]|nr:ABC transporter substrate-binding protein [Burkholderiaceae bacterium]
MRRRELIASLPALGALDARGQAMPRKTLHVAFPAPETALDPAQNNTDLYSSTILAQILEAPLTFDYLARPARLVTATAASLPEVSADGRRFTIRLQPGVHFADDAAFKGQRRELVAADYVYSIKRFYDPKYNSSDLYLYESVKLPGLSELRQRAVKNRTPFDYDTEVEGLRTLDRYTFVLVLGEADPRFIYRFADPVYCGAVAREVVEFYGDDIVAHPVGTGAFRLKGWRRASRITLERSPTYRRVTYSGQPAAEPVARTIAARLKDQTLPRVDEIIVDIVEEAQPRWLSFLRGDYNWLAVTGEFRQLAAPNGKLAPYLAKRGVQLQSSVQPTINMSFFYMEHPLVGGYTPEKVALRRAIALAFDGDTYVRHVLGGFGVRAQSTVPPLTSGYDPDYKSEMSDYDPARAKALLDLYGYVDRDGDGWREQPDGSKLVLRMSSMSSLVDRRANELWRRALDAVGLRIEFDISTWPELLKKSRAGTLMMWGYGWTAGSPDGGFFLSIAYGPNAGEANDPRFSRPHFDRLFEKQRAMPDGPQREAVMREAKDMLVAYMPYKVHAHTVVVDLVQPWTHGYWRHPFARDIWRYIDIEAQP